MARSLGTTVAALVLVATGCAGHPHHGAAPVASGPTPTTAATVAPTTTTIAPAPMAVVAQARLATLDVFGEPGATTAQSHLANPRELGGPLVLLVTERRPGWLRALLPVRPNGTQGWVRDSDVSVSQHGYRITVELGAHRLTLRNGNDVVEADPVAVGTGDTPTPGGRYYTEDFVKLDDPSGPYGAYAYGLSGFSDVLTSFGGGPGQLAIHGTNEPELLGHDVSHGCIRMSNEAITRLAAILPLGVPVDVQA